MKYTASLAALLLITACGDTDTTSTEATAPAAAETKTPTPAPVPAPIKAAYDPAKWNIYNYWGTEYPSGISIIEDGVSVMARAAMDPAAPRDISCPLPKMATYQTWNGDRVTADNVDFVTVAPIINFTMSAPLTIETWVDGDTPTTLDLAIGDTVTYLVYMSEGFGRISYGGKEYEVDVQAFSETSDLNAQAEASESDQLWFTLKCHDAARTQAWLKLDEVEFADGIAPTPITGWGESADLTEETLKQAIDERAAIKAYRDSEE